LRTAGITSRFQSYGTQYTFSCSTVPVALFSNDTF
jgi:hypothetical protein